MPAPTLIWGAPQWLTPVLTLLGIAALAILWSYGRSSPARGRVRLVCALLKGAGLAALALILLEPLLAGSKPKRGANAFAILADNSRSLTIKDQGADRDRGDWLRSKLDGDELWRSRLAQDFDVRDYLFDSRLRSVEGFKSLTFDGGTSALAGSLSALAKRFRGLPLAGVLVFSDGNATDLADIEDSAWDWSALPPIYPVRFPSRGAARDIGVTQASVTQSNFEAAPAAVRADVKVYGFSGETIIAVLTDEAGEEIERQKAKASGRDQTLHFRFQFRPKRKGVSFCKVKAFASADEPAKGSAEPASTREQTLANNERLVVIDQGGGPYRVLYVGGRPNWEFKFLRRGLEDDDQTQLIGLLRIARRQPKFDFQSSGTRKTSPLFTGFDHPDAETAERADQPVIVRLGTVDESELRDGFPKTAEELYKYHAIVLDDLESAFFTQDQLTLIRSFVSVRGGGFLMLGGPDSLAAGKYDRTPVGDLLPVYLNSSLSSSAIELESVNEEHRFALTREGWLQPWVRTRKTEDEEQRRLAAMPGFRMLSGAGGVKPGAAVLAEVIDRSGKTRPALAAQPFGKGRAGAILIGDLWRWGMRRDHAAESDLERSWRQTIRWLVSDVPGRVDVSARPNSKAEGGPDATVIAVRARDAEYKPLDNAKVALKITMPDGAVLNLDAEPDSREPGAYSASYAAKQNGPYRVVADVVAPDGGAVGEREAGWVAQPSADEFARLEPDADLLQRIAEKTGGEVVDGDRLDAFVDGLSSRDAPITETWTAPFWHHPLYFLIAIVCLGTEWGLRRWNGLA